MRNHEAEAAADLLTPRQVAEALRQAGDLPELLREAGGALEAVGIVCNHLEEACALCPDFEALALAIEADGAAREQLVAACEVAAKAELYDPATGIIDADVLEAVQETARTALAAADVALAAAKGGAL